MAGQQRTGVADHVDETSRLAGEGQAAGESRAGTGERRPEQRGQGRIAGSAVPLVLSIVLVVVAVLFAVTAVYLRHARDSTQVRAVGMPSNVSTPLSNMMGLSKLPGTPAPGFTLVDQRGHTFSLSDFRGRSVVLEFMDSHCTDICPIVSQEFVDAYRDLGSASRKVVFMAVNVNQYHNSVSDMASYSQLHGLDAIRSWHFFTGPVDALKTVWHEYGVLVQAPNPNADIIHTSELLFIDPHGIERYIAAPTVDHTKSGKSYLPSGPLTEWGRGIALVAQDVG